VHILLGEIPAVKTLPFSKKKIKNKKNKKIKKINKKIKNK
jgi:hypothetical protein